MTKEKIEIDKCNCEQSLSLEKQLFESNLMIQKLNNGKSPELIVKALTSTNDVCGVESIN